MPLGIACTNDEKIKVTAKPTSQSGRPAQLDGPLRITVQSGEGTFTQDPAEPNSFFAVSGDNPGTTEYLVEGDSDLGAGQTLLQDQVVLEVSGAQAANFGLVVSAPEPK